MNYPNRYRLQKREHVEKPCFPQQFSQVRPHCLTSQHSRVSARFYPSILKNHLTHVSARCLIRHRAFTFMEIMIVVVIIGLLVSLSAISLIGRLNNSKVKIAQTAIDGLLTSSVEMFYVDNNFYPTTEQGLSALLTKPSTSPVPEHWNAYLKSAKALKDPWDRPYEYAWPSTREGNAEFDLWSQGKNPDDPSDDIGNWEEK